MIIDAKDLVLGRLATVAAKKAINGEKVIIVNSEKAVITGEKYQILRTFKQKRDRGTFKGPFVLRLPERLVKRTIRGMLPYKQEKGKKAFERIKCYRGVPEEFNGKAQSLPEAVSRAKAISVQEICKYLGAKI